MVMSWRYAWCAAGAIGVICVGAGAEPVQAGWPVEGADSCSAVASAALAGWYAAADSRGDTVEIRDIEQRLIRTITREELAALTPWMNFNTDADGPVALAFSDSGRLLFIAVCDTVGAPDGQPGDAILRYDTQANTLSVFARVELGGFTLTATPAMAHFKGKLYVTTAGVLTRYSAGMNDVSAGAGTQTQAIAGASGRMGLAIDRAGGAVYVGFQNSLRRASVVTGTLSFANVTDSLSDGVSALAWSDHYGGAGQNGLYVLHPTAAAPNEASPEVSFVTAAAARGSSAFGASVYLRGAGRLSSLAATAEGRLLAGSLDGNAVQVRDNSDTRMEYSAWAMDEFAQVVRFGKGLISPDGEPPGWVIDGDVQLGWSRFHPVTPDGAAWVVLLLLASDRVNGDASARGLVRQILVRYAGMASGPAPTRTSDGIFRHWIDPATGGVKAGWDPEYATMSTMKIVLAAARARAYYPGDSVIDDAATAIICGVQNWDRYFDATGTRMYLKGLASGGPDGSSLSAGWHEGLLFAEQGGVFGSTRGPAADAAWFERGRWPTGQLVAGRLITSTASGSIGPAFISLYPLLLLERYRENLDWQAQVFNLRLTSGAWTDDNGPRFNTVFSAGTTRSDWGGYHADSLTSHPGDVTTFPALLALAAGTGQGPPTSSPAVGAYQAYRNGARQTFLGGASILYRRSAIDPGYQPDSAGLPDVAMGGLGLAELLRPGSVNGVLTGDYPPCGPCRGDWNLDGGVDGADVEAFFQDWEAGQADINADGGVDGADVETFFSFWESGC